jgi:hypothetical protein
MIFSMTGQEKGDLIKQGVSYFKAVIYNPRDQYVNIEVIYCQSIYVWSYWHQRSYLQTNLPKRSPLLSIPLVLSDHPFRFDLWVIVERLVNDIKSKIVHGIWLRWPLRLCFCSCYFITIASRFAARYALLVIIQIAPKGQNNKYHHKIA